MITNRDRIAMVDQYLDGAAAIDARTNVPAAKSFWQHLMCHGVIGAPRASADGHIKGQVIKNLNACKNPPLIIMPLFEEDVQLGCKLIRVLQVKNSSAFYMPLANIIFLRASYQETRFVKGCLFLHECGHAKRAADEGRIGYPGEEGLHLSKLCEERDMHELEGQLWAELDQYKYQTALSIGVQWAKRAL